MVLRRVCVFCGSSDGARAEYLAAAGRSGETLAGRGIGLVYGGAHVGLMGAWPTPAGRRAARSPG